MIITIINIIIMMIMITKVIITINYRASSRTSLFLASSRTSCPSLGSNND